MTYWDGRDPSGKAVACSMIALCLVVCAPALIVYLDGQAVEYLTVYGSDDPTAYDGVIRSSSNVELVTPSETGGDYISTFVYTAQPSNNVGRIWYYLVMDSAAYDEPVDSIAFTYDSALLRFNGMALYQGEAHTDPYVMAADLTDHDDGTTTATIVFDSLDRYYLNNAQSVDFSFTNIGYVYSEDTPEFEQTFSMEIRNIREFVPFETILIVTGILLIIAAIYATPYVSFGDITGWTEKGVKGAYAGGKKMINNRRK